MAYDNEAEFKICFKAWRKYMANYSVMATEHVPVLTDLPNI